MTAVSFREAFWVWARIAALSFGGPAAQIAVMHRILVDEKRWIGETRFLHALNYCMLLPGPEAQQLATYIGWLMHRTPGGLMAGLLFIFPGMVAILALSWLYVLAGHIGAVAGLFFGLKAAVLAVVLQAVQRVGKKALRNRPLWAIAGASFIAIHAFDLPFPLIIFVAAAIGFLGGKLGWAAFDVHQAHGATGRGLSDAESLLGAGVPDHARPSARWSILIAAVFLTLWLGPVLVLNLLLGPDNVFAAIGNFFSKMAVVTFGGAYAVLAYVAQEAVATYGWLQPGEMMDGLGLAETTPGPLIMVTQFVGFMGAWRAPGSLDPLLAATLGGLLTTWVTFTPCFLWIFLGAPYVEALRGQKALSAALTAITAAVVGVILNLALWFALHVLFWSVRPWSGYGVQLDLPDPGSLDIGALALASAAILLLFRFKRGTGEVLIGCAIVGVGIKLLAGT